MLGEGLMKAGCEKQRVCEIGIVPAAAKCYLLLISLLVSPTARRLDNVDALVAAQAVRGGACSWGLHARAAAHLRVCHGQAMVMPCMHRGDGHPVRFTPHCSAWSPHACAMHICIYACMPHESMHLVCAL